jgi:hypothetical protein
MGRLAEIIDSALAAAELHRRAKQAANEVARVGKLTVQEGNPGDDAVNDWIEKVMVLYREITGNEPRTSVGGPINRMRELPLAPSFVSWQPRAKPLGIEFSEDAWRSRVRTILEGASRQK